MEKENFVICVEGMVSSGKSSMCKELIKLIPNCIYIDTGYIYRGIVFALIKNGISLTEAKENVLKYMKELDVEFNVENGITEVYIAGEKIKNDEIESMENSMGVSKVASIANNKPLYAFGKQIIENYKKNFNVICSGRGMINMYPEMDCHLFITASLDARVQRRYKQYDGKYSLEEVRKSIEERDKLHEASGFNQTCDVTLEIDLSDCNSAKESAQKVLNEIKAKGIV